MKLLKKLYPAWLSGRRENKSDLAEDYQFVITYGPLEIGTLSTKNENGNRNYIFKYSEQFKKQYEDKSAKTIVRKLTGFKDFKEYKSSALYPFFLGRMPDPNRPIIKEIVEKEKIDASDPLAILERFGERTLDNPFIVRRVNNKFKKK